MTDLVESYLFHLESIVREWGEMEVLDVVDSTNEQAKRYITSGGAGNYLCIANQQQAGRGRCGRRWVSPPDVNIYASLSWPISAHAQRAIDHLSGLSLVVGLSIASTLSDHARREAITVKWPNDILCNGKKISGVLIDILTAPTGKPYAIIGFGVNVHEPEQLYDVNQMIGQPWTCLARELAKGVCFTRPQLMAALLQQINRDLFQFSEKGWPSFLSQWKQFDSLIGRSVSVQNGAQSLCGVAMGVDACGRLLVKTDADKKIVNLTAGDVQVRRVPLLDALHVGAHP